MRYVKIENGVPTLYTFNQLKQDNPNVSFPREPSASILADYGVFALQEDPRPEAEVIEKGPIEERNGEWWQTYSSRAFTAEEVRPGMVVTMRQARLALLDQGLLASVTAAIAALPDGEREAAEIQWEYGNEVERLSPLAVALTSAIGLTDEAVDDLFVLAETL
jgi:hypothetical protein